MAKVNRFCRWSVNHLRVAEELPRPTFEHKQEKEMNKLLSVIVAALFAVSTTAFVASPVGAQTKDEKKTEKKAPPKDAKKAPPKDAKKAPPKDAKKAPPKDAKKAPAKKDEMKK
jgi:hypothetical protein